MNASDELLTVAELAIGLAGFSGVVVAFAYRGQLTAIDQMRFIALFTIAIATAMFAFLPFAFSHTGLSDPAIWRWSSGLFFAWALVQGFVLAPRLRRAAVAAGAAVSIRLNLVLLALVLLNFALQILNALAWPFDPGPLPFVGGLLIYLGLSAFFFCFLVLFRPRDPDA